MGHWFHRSGAGPVTGLGMTTIGAGAVLTGMAAGSRDWETRAPGVQAAAASCVAQRRPMPKPGGQATPAR